MRRTSGYIKVDRKQPIDPTRHLLMAAENPARYGTGTGGDHQFRLGDRLIGAEGRRAHVFGDRPGNQHTIGVARRGDEIDAKPAGVENDIAERVHLDLAPVATAGTDLAQPQRPAKDAAQLLRKGVNVRRALAGDKEFGPIRSGESPIIGEPDQIIRTDRDTITAENAPAQVEAQSLGQELDGFARTD